MTGAAKDEAELLCAMVDAIWEYLTPDTRWTAKPYVERDLAAAIRAAGWAVVPVALMEEAIEELSAAASANSPVRASYPLMMRRYMRDMELPNAIRAAIEPEVKP